MDRQQMPFLFRFLSDSELYAFKDGQIISTFNKCGLFFCQKVIDEQDEKRRKATLQASYNVRMLLQAVWIIVSIGACPV